MTEQRPLSGTTSWIFTTVIELTHCCERLCAMVRDPCAMPAENDLIAASKETASLAAVLSKASREALPQSQFWTDLIQRMRASVALLITSVRSVYFSPNDLQSTQTMNHNIKKVAILLQRMAASVNVQQGESAVNTPLPTHEGLRARTCSEEIPVSPPGDAVNRITPTEFEKVILTADATVKSFKSLQDSIASQNKEKYVEAVNNIVTSFTGFISVSRKVEVGYESRLKGSATRCAQLSKIAFGSPNNQMYLEHFRRSIAEACRTMQSFVHVFMPPEHKTSSNQVSEEGTVPARKDPSEETKSDSPPVQESSLLNDSHSNNKEQVVVGRCRPPPPPPRTRVTSDEELVGEVQRVPPPGAPLGRPMPPPPRRPTSDGLEHSGAVSSVDLPYRPRSDGADSKISPLRSMSNVDQSVPPSISSDNQPPTQDEGSNFPTSDVDSKESSPTQRGQATSSPCQASSVDQGSKLDNLEKQPSPVNSPIAAIQERFARRRPSNVGQGGNLPDKNLDDPTAHVERKPRLTLGSFRESKGLDAKMAELLSETGNEVVSDSLKNLTCERLGKDDDREKHKSQLAVGEMVDFADPTYASGDRYVSSEQDSQEGLDIDPLWSKGPSGSSGPSSVQSGENAKRPTPKTKSKYRRQVMERCTHTVVDLWLNKFASFKTDWEKQPMETRRLMTASMETLMETTEKEHTVIGKISGGEEGKRKRKASREQCAVQMVDLFRSKYPSFRTEWDRLPSDTVRLMVEAIAGHIKAWELETSLKGVASATVTRFRGLRETAEDPNASLHVAASICELLSKKGIESFAEDLFSCAEDIGRRSMEVFCCADEIVIRHGFPKELPQLIEVLFEQLGCVAVSVSHEAQARIEIHSKLRGALKISSLAEELSKRLEKAAASSSQLDEAATSGAVGHHRKMVEESVHKRILSQASYSRSIVVQVMGQLASLGRLYDTGEDTPSIFARTVQLLAAIFSCQASICNLHGLLATYYQITSSAADGGVSAQVEEALETLGKDSEELDLVCKNTNVWEEKEEPFLAESGVFKGGNLNHIVTHATAIKSYNTKFLKAFISTYQSYCTPYELLQKLEQRYRVPEGAVEPMEGKLIQQRVGVVLKYWIDNQFRDFDQKLIADLFEFVKQFEADSHLKMGASLRKELTNKKEILEMQLQLQAITQPLMMPSVSPISFLVEASNTEIAEQITVIERSIFSKIAPSELLNMNWSKKRKKHRSPNVLAMINRSNFCSNFVCTMIVAQVSLQMRKKMMQKFISVAESLRKHNNFNGLMGVLAGLTMAPVSRLKITMEQLKEKFRRILKEYRDLMNPGHSWALYREALHDSGDFCVPYLGTYLTDLTFMNDGNPDMVTNPSNNQTLINFRKREMIYTAIQEIQLYQNMLCPYSPKEPLYTFLLQVPYIEEADLFSLSLQVEPRGVTNKKDLPLL